jgi:hypothetical protein
MQVARRAGATGGTVIRGRLADFEQFAELENSKVDEEREILCILAPLNASKQIMEDVNREFGITTEANGIISSIPTTPNKSPPTEIATITHMPDKPIEVPTTFG